MFCGNQVPTNVMIKRITNLSLTALSQTITPFASSLLKPSKPPLNFLSLHAVRPTYNINKDKWEMRMTSVQDLRKYFENLRSWYDSYTTAQFSEIQL